MNIFVTGGAGFIGSHVVRRLVELGHNVTLYDSFVNYLYPLQPEHLYNIERRMEGLDKKVRILRGHTQDLDFLRRALFEAKPARIIHLAAMPLANLAVHHPEEALNSILTGTMNLLQVGRDLDSLERFVYVSSSMVYGDFARTPVREDDRTDPKEVYGALKLSGEVLTKAFGRLYEIEYTIVRPSAVYGPTDNNSRVLGLFLENALNGKPLQVKGPGQALDFSFVTDVAEGMCLAATHPDGGGKIFNITRGEGRTLGDAAHIVAKLIPGTVVQEHEANKLYPKRGALDISNARDILGYRPKVNLEQGLLMYAEYLKDQRANLQTFPIPAVANA